MLSTNFKRIFKSNVLNVSPYGSECRKTIKTAENKRNSFQTKCLRWSRRIFWLKTVGNNTLLAEMQVRPLISITKGRRWPQLGVCAPDDWWLTAKNSTQMENSEEQEQGQTKGSIEKNRREDVEQQRAHLSKIGIKGERQAFVEDHCGSFMCLGGT